MSHHFMPSPLGGHGWRENRGGGEGPGCQKKKGGGEQDARKGGERGDAIKGDGSHAGKCYY